ncbi:MAG: hypothetical protein DMF89_04710 [Acidobacteria bacterium]|nr:MAG: hypothetical protein DMF89_04710 [Acidobacteriota bacterium]
MVWRVLVYSAVPVVGVWLLAGWFQGFDRYHGSWWAHRVTIYPVACDGTSVSSSVCCGKLGVPLNPTTFTVSVERQMVFDSIAGIMTPLHNCEVQDYLNWQCTTYWDASESKEVGPSEGAAYDRTIMSAGSYREVHSVGLTDFTSAGQNACSGSGPVDVRGVDWYLGQIYGWWAEHKGVWAESPNYAQRPSTDLICRIQASP